MQQGSQFWAPLYPGLKGKTESPGGGCLSLHYCKGENKVLLEAPGKALSSVPSNFPPLEMSRRWPPWGTLKCKHTQWASANLSQLPTQVQNQFTPSRFCPINHHVPGKPHQSTQAGAMEPQNPCFQIFFEINFISCSYF